MTGVSHCNTEKKKSICAQRGHRIVRDYKNVLGIHTSLLLFLGVGENSEAYHRSARPSQKRSCQAVLEISSHFNSYALVIFVPASSACFSVSIFSLLSTPPLSKQIFSWFNFIWWWQNEAILTWKPLFMFFLDRMICSLSLTTKDFIRLPFITPLRHSFQRSTWHALPSHKTHHLSADLAMNKERKESFLKYLTSGIAPLSPTFTRPVMTWHWIFIFVFHQLSIQAVDTLLGSSLWFLTSSSDWVSHVFLEFLRTYFYKFHSLPSHL